jgi:hypothetical protein
MFAASIFLPFDAVLAYTSALCRLYYIGGVRSKRVNPHLGVLICELLHGWVHPCDSYAPSLLLSLSYATQRIYSPPRHPTRRAASRKDMPLNGGGLVRFLIHLAVDIGRGSRPLPVCNHSCFFYVSLSDREIIVYRQGSNVSLTFRKKYMFYKRAFWTLRIISSILALRPPIQSLSSKL